MKGSRILFLVLDMGLTGGGNSCHHHPHVPVSGIRTAKVPDITTGGKEKWQNRRQTWMRLT